MKSGAVAVLGIVIPALLVGGGIYYMQVYGFYDRLPTQDTMTVATPDGPAQLAISGFEGIDSNSSPLRYRACFHVEGPLPQMTTYTDATPLYAPGWFGCFNAETIGADLEAGRARGVLVERDFTYGFDRVMALYPDGRAYVWPQVNPCGAAYFEDDPLPQGCPLPPSER